MPAPHIGMLLSRVRVEEKLLLTAFQDRGIDVEMLDDRQLIFDLGRDHPRWKAFDVVLERCINHSRALYALRILDGRSGGSTRTTCHPTPNCEPPHGAPVECDRQ